MFQEIIHYACFAVYLVWLRGQIKLTEILIHIKGKTVGKLTCNVNHLVRTPSILWVNKGAYPYYKEAINARHVEGSSTRGGINKSKGADGEPTTLRELFGLWSLCKLKCK